MYSHQDAFELFFDVPNPRFHIVRVLPALFAFQGILNLNCTRRLYSHRRCLLAGECEHDSSVCLGITAWDGERAADALPVLSVSRAVFSRAGGVCVEPEELLGSIQGRLGSGWESREAMSC